MEFGYEEKQRRKDYIIRFFLSLIGGIVGTFSTILFITFLAWLGSDGVNKKSPLTEIKKELTDKKVFVEVKNKDSDDNWPKNQIIQEKVKEELETWLNSIKFLPYFRRRNDGGANKHALFYGPPGTGKSYTARLLGEKESLAYGFFRFEGEIYVGTSKIKIDDAFQEAKRILEEEAQKPEDERSDKPIFIIVDEIDSVGVKDFSFGSNSKNEPINCLLALIDDIERDKLNIIVIGITNYCEMLESALIRSGRLGNKVEFDYPNKEELKKSVQTLKEKLTDKEYNDGNEQEKGIKWTENFWKGVEEIALKQEKGEFNLIDMELAIQRTLAKNCKRDTCFIQLKVENYQKELEKLSEKKNVKGKKNNRQGEVPEQTLTPELLRRFFEFLPQWERERERVYQVSSSTSA
jgi:SpoVK/Ycf46/Vps4 family AAA+-type ATPase